ncbi:MAG: hypothetical protein GF311_09490 [Candidatus Lokiarchaeota archaeon]|nr:hypothetical protein [Candidatus Lokiarchaeota archaeon]
MKSKESKSKKKISLKNAIGYGFGQFSDTVAYQTFTFLTFTFYFSVVGLSIDFITFGFIIWAIWNSLNDPLLGTLSDKTRKYELLQTQEEYIRVIQHVQHSAREYFLKLKELSFLLERERINLREQRFKRHIGKTDYKDKLKALQEIMQYITRVLTFLNRSILFYRYE